MVIDPSIFKDYDIRAVVPEQLDEEGMYHLGQAIATYFKPKAVTIGRDIRLSSQSFFQQIARALTEVGVDVVDIGLITTDMSYFASATLKPDVSLMITASHNPPQYNGLKIVTKGAIAVSGEQGIFALRDLITNNQVEIKHAKDKGKIQQQDIWQPWIEHALTFVDTSSLKPLKILVDAGNGLAGKMMEKFAPHLPLHITPMYFEPDGRFPNHLPYPLLDEATQELRRRVVKEGFDLGVAWDGDADRMFLIDNEGMFVDGTTFGAVLADAMLNKSPGDKVIYNAVIGRIVPEIVRQHKGTPIRWNVGHTLLKQKMREEDALLAVEHSGHFFFRDNYYCDSGIIAFLMALEIISKSNQPLHELLAKYRTYPMSGEINFKVEDKQKTMKAIEEAYKEQADSIDWLDGITVWFKDWWFNVRPSNTQPLLRLTVEVNNTQQLSIDEQTEQLVSFIETRGGKRVEE